jgi:hypothetical protein
VTPAADLFEDEVAPVTAPSLKPKANVFDKAVLLSVDFGLPGNSKRVNPALIETDADRERIGVSKKLIDSPELDAVRKFDSNFRRWLYSIALPSQFKSGIFLWPIVAVEKAEERLREAETKRQELVEKACAAYLQKVSEAAGPLGSLYAPGDYLTLAQFRESFEFAWQYIAFGVPGQLKSIAPAIFEAEREKAAKQIADVTSNIQDVLRAGLLELVEHLADKLSGTRVDGKGNDKPKIFRDSSITGLREFLDNFNIRDLTNDTDLQALANKAKMLLDGVDPKTLRNDDTLRERVREGFSEVRESLNQLMVDAPSRRIRLGGE